VIHIELSAIPEIVAASTHSATMKAQRRHTADTWQRGRTDLKKFTDLFPGDLAKNIVYDYLTGGLGLQIVNYDQIRTDDWCNSDPYDLKLGDATIEVKSSIEKSLVHVEEVQKQRRVMIYAQLQHLNNHIFQVYYIGENDPNLAFCKDIERLPVQKLQQKYSFQTFSEFVELFCAKIQRAHIMAFVDRPLAERYMQRPYFRYRSNRSSENARDYLNLFIRDAYSPDDFRPF
jgi:hypothetical protein